MYKVQFTARVINPDTEETTTGWINPARRYEVHESHTDVPTFGYGNYADAVDAIENFMGSFTEEDRNGTSYCYAEDADINYETGESYIYGAYFDRPEPESVQITVDFMLEFADEGTVTAIANRLREIIRNEYMPDGEDLYGYDGPMVLTNPVTTRTK